MVRLRFDGEIEGVRTIDSGIEGLAWAVSDARAELRRLRAEGFYEEPNKGGTIKWVAGLFPVGLWQMRSTEDMDTHPLRV